jgi:Holliday junction resolvasome RuvABC DNA-binding subunit
MLNPYANFLGERSPLEVLSATPGKLEAILEQLGPTGIEKPPAPGKWNAREIVSHLADCEITFAFRLRQTLAEDDHVIQPFDQEKWAANYAGYDARTALAAFSAVRQWNLALIKSASSEKWMKTVTHPERGTMTFSTIVETIGGHDLNHLQQLQAIVGKFAD